MSANDNKEIPQVAFDLYDEFAHGDIDRREFISRLGGLTLGGLTLGTLTSALLPNYALAEQVSFNDPEIKASYAEFDSPKGHGKGRGYLVQPSSINSFAPVVLVVHENRGLNPYIKDVAKMLQGGSQKQVLLPLLLMLCFLSAVIQEMMTRGARCKNQWIGIRLSRILLPQPGF